MRFSSILVAVAFSCAATTALAASSDEGKVSLSEIEGKVLVLDDQGTNAKNEAKSGSRILVGADSSVKLSFESGCTAELGSDQVYTVPASAPCGKGENVAVIDGLDIEAASFNHKGRHRHHKHHHHKHQMTSHPAGPHSAGTSVVGGTGSGTTGASLVGLATFGVVAGVAGYNTVISRP